ncbi:MAG: hypothetical protein J1F43_00835 [Muribaculaceae bacterium]|nr:hypothetical protein [Muribaculaceae bacterium]
MDADRFNLERSVIANYMHNPSSYQFVNAAVPYLRIVAQTNGGTPYVLRIECPDYPNSKPNAYVECMLKDHNGNPMNSASATNHTLSPHSNNWTQICHYHPNAWKPNMSLWMVYVRCVIWLNIYEKTLQSKQTMDYYLSHMSETYSREEYLRH